MPKVLIIDDDAGIREVLSEGLVLQGFLATCASSGRQGLDLLKNERPDVIILDVMMPGLDGFQVCRTLKESPETSQIPIVFLTARAAPADVQRGLSLGADDYLSKPIDIYELADRLRKVIKE